MLFDSKCKDDVLGKVQDVFAKKLQRQGVRLVRGEAYCFVRHNDEGGSATKHMDFFTKPGDQLRLTETSVETPCFRIVTP